MASSTRQSIVAAKATLTPLLATADLKFAEELFAVGAAVASSTQLRSILSDPSAEAAAKSGALVAVFGKNLSKTALEFVTSLVGLRWSTGQDLVSAFEQLAVFAVSAIAAENKNLAKVESELFAFQSAVDSDQELQFALGDQLASEEAKLKLVEALTKGKVTAEAATLIRRAITGARRRRVSVVLEQFGKQVSEFALRLVATVTVAAPISASQLQRLEAVLAKSYGQSLKLNVEVDENILGGIKVQVAGEILDGSLSSRLTAAKLQLA
ncbi:F0F1 ATP synthase subunit delta [Rhodoluna sp.]|uniref:F0F1 ATP synthase subunit delta n=1 Tax=Rhodoluna sp. TaxID=1969481 RepID=UPI0025D6C791|nr:F0F1 ATP synthase subunit delta [Rhodoluna sp.]